MSERYNCAVVPFLKYRHFNMKRILPVLFVVFAADLACATISYCEKGTPKEHSHFSSVGIDRARGVSVKARGPNGWATSTNDHPLVRWSSRMKGAELSIAIDIVPVEKEKTDLYVEWIREGRIEGDSAQMDVGDGWRETTNGVRQLGNVKAVTADFLDGEHKCRRRFHAIPAEHDRIVLVDFSVRSGESPVRMAGDAKEDAKSEELFHGLQKLFSNGFEVNNPKGQPGTRTSSTAWFVSPRHLVTCAHCAEGWMHFWYYGESGKRVKLRLVDRDGENDLALLELEDAKRTADVYLKVARQTPRVAEKVWTLGYSLPQLLGRQIVYGEGVVTGNAGYRGDKRQFMISAPIRPGLSGGPVFTERGGVCGVMSASMTDGEQALQGHPSPESNWAVRADRLRALLERNGVPFAEECDADGGQDRVSAVEKSLKAVVYLHAGAE